MATGIDDSAILAALVANKTIAAAARELQISPRTIYNRMQSGTFRTRLEALRADNLRDACATLQQGARLAALTLQELMLDETVPPAVRLQACRETLHAADLYGAHLRTLEAEHGRAACDLGLDDLVLTDLWDDGDED